MPTRGRWRQADGMELEVSPGNTERPCLNIPPPTKEFFRCELGYNTSIAEHMDSPQYGESTRRPGVLFLGLWLASRGSREQEHWKMSTKCWVTWSSPRKCFFPSRVKNKTSITKTSSSYWFLRFWNIQVLRTCTLNDSAAAAQEQSPSFHPWMFTVLGIGK